MTFQTSESIYDRLAAGDAVIGMTVVAEIPHDSPETDVWTLLNEGKSEYFKITEVTFNDNEVIE